MTLSGGALPPPEHAHTRYYPGMEDSRLSLRERAFFRGAKDDDGVIT